MPPAFTYLPHTQEVAEGTRSLPGVFSMKFLLWCILFVLCWPLALVVLILYPFIWLLLLPFRILGIAVDGVFELLRAILFLPSRLVRAL